VKRIWVTVSSTLLFFLLVTVPALAQYPPGGGGGEGEGDDDDDFDPGEGGGLGDADGAADGAGDGLADTGGRFKVWMLLLMVSLLIAGIKLLMASRRKKTVVVDY
jgi:hypothetical protein